MQLTEVIGSKHFLISDGTIIITNYTKCGVIFTSTHRTFSSKVIFKRILTEPLCEYVLADIVLQQELDTTDY